MSMEICLSGNNIDAEGIWKLLKDECQTCDVIEREDTHTKCSDCIFIKSSRENDGGRRVGCSVILKRYGIETPKELGKHQLFYFLYHPELNFKVPVDPNNPTNWFAIHHENENKTDDRFVNLTGCFTTIHGVITAWNMHKKRVTKKLEEAKTDKERQKINDKFSAFLVKVLHERQRMMEMLDDHAEKTK